MKSKHISSAAVLVLATTVAVLATPGLQAQQFPNPTTAAQVPGPASGNTMTKEYVQMVGRGSSRIQRHPPYEPRYGVT